MQLLLEHDLPYVSIEITYQGAVLEVPRVIVDTRSATTLLSVDFIEQIGIAPEPGASDRATSAPLLGAMNLPKGARMSWCLKPVACVVEKMRI
jgi:hypothetical protein